AVDADDERDDRDGRAVARIQRRLVLPVVGDPPRAAGATREPPGVDEVRVGYGSCSWNVRNKRRDGVRAVRRRSGQRRRRGECQSRNRGDECETQQRSAHVLSPLGVEAQKGPYGEQASPVYLV